MRVCVRACARVCVLFMCVCVCLHLRLRCGRVYVCLRACVYVFVYTCVRVCTCEYTHLGK